MESGQTSLPQEKQNLISLRGRVLIIFFDSPVIYGVRVETSNPYHLLYIEKICGFDSNKSISMTGKSQAEKFSDFTIFDSPILCALSKRKNRASLDAARFFVLSKS